MTRTDVHHPLELGGEAPAFRDLLATDGRRYSLESFADKDVLVVVFISNGCPTVRGYDERLVALQNEYSERRAQIVAINSNNPHLSPADTYPEMVARASEGAYTFPYLQDDEAEVAKCFGAVATPHAFVFDRDRRLRYRGRIDDSRDPAKVESSDLREAIAGLLDRGSVRISETQPFGCAIVW